MAKLKESKATYSAEPITVVTARGTTEISRAMRQRYRVTAKSRLKWTDTGHGLLVVPIEKTEPRKNGKLDWEQAAQLWAEREKVGRPIEDADLLIAAQAKWLAAILVTNNEKDFDGLGLQVENWRRK